MARCLSTSFIAVILVFANLILVSSALRSYDVRELGEKTIVLTEDDIVSEDQTARHLDRSTRFIGDLEVGNRRANERVHQGAFNISNPTNQVYSTKISFSTSGIIHYVSVLNEQGSYVVVCDTPYTLGSSISTISVRALPNSRSKIAILATSH